MTLIYRGDRVYCYTSARGPGGRVRGVYLGAGLAALDAQAEIDQEAAERAADRRAGAALVESLEQDGRIVARLDALIEGPFRAAMTRAGYYRHHRQWRRRGKVDDST